VRYLERDRDPVTFAPIGDTWHEYVGDNIYQDLLIDATNPQAPVVTPLARYDFGYNIARVDDTAGQRYVHFDMLGTTRALTDGAGALANALGYTAFGEVLAATGSTLSRYAYVGSWGYQNDGLANPANEIGMLHVGARYYDPAIGRFPQRDKLGIEGGVNDYAYALNVPTLSVDPSGMTSTPEVSFVAAKLAALLVRVLPPVVAGGKLAQTLVDRGFGNNPGIVVRVLERGKLYVEVGTNRLLSYYSMTGWRLFFSTATTPGR